MKWWGVLTGHQWIMHGVGYVSDPTGRTQVVRREATSTIKIQPSLKQELNSNAWNFMFAKDTASACDVTLSNSVSVDTSLFIMGDLCFENSSAVVKAAAPDITNIYVGEHIQFGGTGSVGTAANKINQAQVGLGCRDRHERRLDDSLHVRTRVNATTILSGTSPGSGPTADFAFWYTNAKPGPSQACTTTTGYAAGVRGLARGRHEQQRRHDQPDAQLELQLQVLRHPAEPDRPARRALVEQHDEEADGQGRDLHRRLRGRLEQLRQRVRRAGDALPLRHVPDRRQRAALRRRRRRRCDFTAWDPNTDNLGIIANGNDGSGNSVILENSSRMQGSLYATYAVDVGNFAAYDGPMVAGTFKLANNIVTHEFPTITSVPVGWPGNPTVYAEPQPPQNYSG